MSHVRYGNVEPGFSSLGWEREKCVHGGEGGRPVAFEIDRRVPALLEHEALEKGEDYSDKRLSVKAWGKSAGTDGGAHGLHRLVERGEARGDDASQAGVVQGLGPYVYVDSSPALFVWVPQPVEVAL